MKRSGLRGLKTEKFEWEKEHQKTNRAIWVIRILIVLTITFLIWAQNNLVVTRKYVFASSDLPKAFVGYRIVHVSDICNTPNNLVAAVKYAKPDVIIISGGFEDEKGNSDNSVKAVNELCDIAPVYYIYNTNDKSNRLAETRAINITDQRVALSPNQMDVETFIKKNYGNRILDKASKGDEEAISYVEYVKEALNDSMNSQIYVCGISNYEDLNDVDWFVAETYRIIGPHDEDFVMMLSGNLKHVNAISRTGVDMIFTGGTFGKHSENSEYAKGIYGHKGSAVAVSGGVGNLGDSRILNLPEIQLIVLSDGTIKQNNPLENLLDLFIKDVGTIYDNDGGFKEYHSEGKNIKDR